MKKIVILVVLATLFLFSGSVYADNKDDHDRQHNDKVHAQKKKDPSDSSKRTHDDKSSHSSKDKDDKHDDDNDGWEDDDHDEITYENPVVVFGPKQYKGSEDTSEKFTDSFKALSQEAIIIIEVDNGQTNDEEDTKEDSERLKKVKIKLNGKKIFKSDDFDDREHFLRKVVQLTEDNTLSVKLKSKSDAFLTIKIIQDSVLPPLPTVTISAAPAAVHTGESATLSWAASNADYCVIEPGIGTVATSGAVQVSISQTTTYTVTATGPAGSASAQTTITYLKTPTVSVPDLIGLTQTEAVALIESSSLILGTISNEYSDLFPADSVMGQSLAAGEVVDENTLIDVVISSGPQNTGTTVSLWASPGSIQQG